MTGWELVFLGTMAVALVVMAAAQMAMAREVARVARQTAQTMQDVRRDLQPIAAKLHKITDDLSKASALALVQVERVDQLMGVTAQRIDETVTTIQDAIIGPVRTGAAVMAGVRAALAVFGRGPETGRHTRDEDDALFIG